MPLTNIEALDMQLPVLLLIFHSFLERFRFYLLFLVGVQLLAQWLAPLVLTTWVEVRIPPIAFWGGDLMEGNPRDPSHL